MSQKRERAASQNSKVVCHVADVGVIYDLIFHVLQRREPVLRGNDAFIGAMVDAATNLVLAASLTEARSVDGARFQVQCLKMIGTQWTDDQTEVEKDWQQVQGLTASLTKFLTAA